MISIASYDQAWFAMFATEAASIRRVLGDLAVRVEHVGSTSVPGLAAKPVVVVGADAYFKTLVQTKPGYVRFWSEMETAFDEPFRSYATPEFRQRPALPSGKR
jgi:GrpB-like predicted nucleotidyltransferase (UPF0157 family)